VVLVCVRVCLSVWVCICVNACQQSENFFHYKFKVSRDETGVSLPELCIKWNIAIIATSMELYHLSVLLKPSRVRHSSCDLYIPWQVITKTAVSRDDALSNLTFESTVAQCQVCVCVCVCVDYPAGLWFIQMVSCGLLWGASQSPSLVISVIPMFAINCTGFRHWTWKRPSGRPDVAPSVPLGVWYWFNSIQFSLFV